MSSEKGNTHRQRAQKHQNVNAFKNTLHDTSRRTKIINNTQAKGCCDRCKEIIEWKIKYKKYKLLTVAKKCVKCSQKTVKKAYCIVCQPCAVKFNICVKCAKNEETVLPFEINAQQKLENQSQLEQELKYLPERKRRAFLRNQASGKYAEDVATGGQDADDDDDKSLTTTDEDTDPDDVTCARPPTDDVTCAKSLTDDVTCTKSLTDDVTCTKSLTDDATCTKPLTDDATCTKPLTDDATCTKPLTDDVTCSTPPTDDVTCSTSLIDDVTQTLDNFNLITVQSVPEECL